MLITTTSNYRFSINIPQKSQFCIITAANCILFHHTILMDVLKTNNYFLYCQS